MPSAKQKLDCPTAEATLSTVDATAGTEMRLVTCDDYARLARFFAGFGDETRGEQFWLRRFRLWWDHNPAFREGVPRGWILWEGNQIKGCLGNLPNEFQLNGKSVTAVTATTWRVLPTHRNYSLRLLYQAIRCAKGSIIFNTSPSEDTVSVMKGIKFNLFPYYAAPRKGVIIVNPRRVLRSRAGGRFGAALAAWLGAPVLRFYQHYRSDLSRGTSGISVRQLTHADSSFDDLWLRTRSRYAHTNVRSAAATNWQCFGNEDLRKLLFGCFSGERLVGYLIAGIRVRNGLNVASCVDLWLDPDSPSALRHLLSFLRTWAGDANVDLIEIPHFDLSLGQQLAALGLFEHTVSGEQPAFYKAPDLGELNSAESYLVTLQGDRGL
jgi:hypothetical protein